MNNYRFGFQGQEEDSEIAGQGNSYTAEYWQYDARRGQRWNVDPITFPWQSSYATFNNNPIYHIDPLGLYGDKHEAKQQRKAAIKSGEYTRKQAGKIYNTRPEDVSGEWGFNGTDDNGNYTSYFSKDFKSCVTCGSNLASSNSHISTIKSGVPLASKANQPNLIEQASFSFSMGSSIASTVNAYSSIAEDLKNAKNVAGNYKYINKISSSSSSVYDEVSWLGRNGKLYPFSLGGNQWTGPRTGAPTIKSMTQTTITSVENIGMSVEWNVGAAMGKYSSLTRIAGGVGYGLGALNYFSISSQWLTGDIGDFQFGAELGSNTFSTFAGLYSSRFGLYGAAWGIGWEGGRLISNTNAWQRFKGHYFHPFIQSIKNW